MILVHCCFSFFACSLLQPTERSVINTPKVHIATSIDNRTEKQSERVDGGMNSIVQRGKSYEIANMH